jgi:hypothetical protein
MIHAGRHRVTGRIAGDVYVADRWMRCVQRELYAMLRDRELAVRRSAESSEPGRHRSVACTCLSGRGVQAYCMIREWPSLSPAVLGGATLVVQYAEACRLARKGRDTVRLRNGMRVELELVRERVIVESDSVCASAPFIGST